MKSVLNGIVIGFIIIGIIWLILYLKDSAPQDATTQAVSTFGECELAGFAVTGSDPRICTTPNGQTFEEPFVGDPGVGL